MLEKEQKIPKIIHCCWFGKNPMPKLAKDCIDSWKKYCPDYKIKIWSEKNFDINSNRFTKEAYQNKKWAFVTDYVRLHALYNEGGIYMDTDVEVVKNLDKFLKNSAFSGFEDFTTIPTGIMASEKKHNWIKLLLNEYENKHFVVNGVLDTTPNTQLITKITKKNYPIKLNNTMQKFEDGLCIFPKEFFCPISYKDNKLNFTKNTHTIHHFAGSWMSKKERFLMWIKKNIINKYFKFLEKPLTNLYRKLK